MRNKILVVTFSLLATTGCVSSFQHVTIGGGFNNSSESFAFSEQDIILSRAAHAVTMHPEGPLMASNYCSSMITSIFSSRFGFDNTLIALRNRAALIGSNAVAVRSWTVIDSNASIIARFYYCNSKKDL